MPVEFSVLFYTPNIINLMLEGYKTPPELHFYLEEPNALQALTQVIHNRKGSDVAVVGDTWLRGFYEMNALRPFSTFEVTRLGGANAFLPQAWEMTRMKDDPNIWSIPWMIGTRNVFFHRNLLEESGIVAETAFNTAEHFEETLVRLRSTGFVNPFGMDLVGVDLVHQATAWLRGEGGNIMAEDGSQVFINQPQSKAGLEKFFRLLRYIAPEARGDWVPQYITPEARRDWWSMFLRGEIPVGLSGSWFWNHIRVNLPSEQFNQIGVASPPGTPFFGSNHLVIWNHARQVEGALDLVRYLTSVTAFNKLPVDTPGNNEFPARLDVLNAPPFTTDQNYQAIRATIEKSRGFRNWHLGSMIEDRLTQSFYAIAKEVIDNPENNIRPILDQHLDPLAKHLNGILSNL